MNLTTTYLGLELRSPLVPSASPLCEKLDNLKRMEDAGASAVVLHSLFEEQIRADQFELETSLDQGSHSNPEALTYFPGGRDFALDPEGYLRHLSRAKEALEIPVVGSLNGATFGGWTSFASQMEQAGADALELNLYSVPTDSDASAESIEENYLSIVTAIKDVVRIPVAVKLSPWFTNLTHFARHLERRRVDGLVLFNRFFQPDFDLDTSEIQTHAQLSTSSAALLPLRWIALLRPQLQVSLAATSGVHRGTDALKLLMAGADVTMLCSALMRFGIDHLWTVEREIKEWMEQHEYESVAQLKGRMSQASSPDPAAFERAQYLRTIGAFQG
jgi:dihydroorotate dehydrogenase (fumarate)